MYKLSIIVILLMTFYILYMSYINYLQKNKKLTHEAAKTYASNILGEKIDDLLSRQVPEYVPDVVLQTDMVNALKSFNQLPPDKVPFCISEYGCFKLPCIQVGLISNSTQNFPVIESVLQNCLEDHLVSQGYPVCCKVSIKEYKAPRYWAYIIYATTKTNRKNFEKVEQMVAARAQKNAVRTVSPMNDPGLDDELQQI